MKSSEDKVKSQKSPFDRTQGKKVKSHTLAVLGSHSALEVCFGAKKLGFATLVVVEKGRDKTYAEYFRTREYSSSEGAIATESRSSDEDNSRPIRQAQGEQARTINYLGCVDEVLYVDKFKDLLTPQVQKKLNDRNAIFIPHRSFEVYVNDYDGIEKRFKVPMFGNRFLLRVEERSEKPNQYDLLAKAGIKHPKRFTDPKTIDRMVLVKVAERERQFERAFFLCHSYDSFQEKTRSMLDRKIITKEALAAAVIEEFALGVQVNFNFFYSPLAKRLELIGTDTRRQTNLEGFVHLPYVIQKQLQEEGVYQVQFEEAGHIAVTVLESLLEQAFAIGERFVTAAQAMFAPGVIGPFGLQTVITPGPPKKEIIVFDVAPRMPGSPGIAATPYSSYLYGRPVSMGGRVAMEIAEAINKKQLDKILT